MRIFLSSLGKNCKFQSTCIPKVDIEFDSIEIFRDLRTWTRDILWEFGAEAFMIPETDLRKIDGDELVAGMVSIQALSKSIIKVGPLEITR